MSDGRDFGTIINERRLELGYSLGQLANRIGVTAAQVRAWERGAETPDDATVGLIAGELDLPGADLRSAIRSAGSAKTAPVRPERPEEATAAVMAVFSDAGDTVSAADPAADPAEGVPLAGDGDPVSDGTHGALGGDDRGPAVGTDLVDEPTEAVAIVGTPAATDAVPAVPVPSPPAGVALTAPPVAPPVGATRPGPSQETQQPGLLAGWNRALHTLFDPERRYLFGLRTALTVLVMLVFLRVLAWAVPAFFDVLGDILDTIETTTDTTVIEPGTGPTTSVPGTTLPTG
jgi:transcriptional regulator with XRE-family HTH domain